MFCPPGKKQYNAIPALVGLGVAAYATREIQRYPARRRRAVARLFRHHRARSIFVYFFYLFLVGAAVAVLISIKYLEIERENHGEFYALLLFAVIGMMCMAAGYDLVLIFIGLELMAISTYILVGFLRSNKQSNEAALKYLLLGAFSSAIFAYGLSLFYGVSGSTNLGDIAPCTHSARGCLSQGSHRNPGAADHPDRHALQDCRRAVPYVGAGRL